MRTKPYTAIGIKRMLCVRCGKPAHAQWNVCADGEYRPICVSCDVELNNLVLTWMKIKGAAAKMKKYRAAIADATD